MISPLAHIHPEAKIGKDVKIDPFVVIDEGVTIGDGTHLMSHSVIMKNTVIGKSCSIFPSAVLGAVPQDLKFDGENTFVQIGDNTTIREFVTVNRGTKDKWKTVIGKNCLIQAYSHIAHDCEVGDHCIFSNSTTLAGHITIGDYVVLAGLVAIHQFVKVGSHAFVTGGSLVRKDVPPYVKAAREPLSYVGINSVGLRRRGFSPEKINEIQEIYRVLFVKNNNVTKALDIIEAEFEPTEIRDEIVDFIRNSSRGVMRGFGSGSKDR